MTITAAVYLGDENKPRARWCSPLLPAAKNPKSPGPEREGKLIGRQRSAPRFEKKVLLSEFLLNDEPRERDQIAKPEAEEECIRDRASAPMDLRRAVLFRRTAPGKFPACDRPRGRTCRR